VRVIVVGAGINGVTSAIELRNRGHDVVLADPGPLPHPLAASTDISKAIRSAYGSDADYTELAERCFKIWTEWNAQFGEELFHKPGFLFMRQQPMQAGDFEFETLQVFERRKQKFERFDSDRLGKRFPAWNAARYHDGFLEVDAGYAESGRVVAALIKRAKSCGVQLREGANFDRLDETDHRVRGIVFSDGTQESADAVVVAVGAWTPYLLPFTRDFFQATGHPVFHLRPENPELFAPERFPVFGADISTTGFYGFPRNRDGVVKVANHGPGREMSPDSPERAVTAEEEKKLREFLSATFPALANAPIVHTRLCMYCDTHDGHFWIAPDPERRGLIIAAGDCGHGFKFAPVLGQLIADAAEEKSNPLLEKFRWRPEVKPGEDKEAARFLPKM
jgi:glycine/D-amino acid oxidase-like deaminating enzyme